jgi:hypothetical protein
MTEAIARHDDVHSLSNKLKSVNFDTPPKIVQQLRVPQQFEPITPDYSVPGSPHFNPQLDDDESTPFSSRPPSHDESSGVSTPRNETQDSTNGPYTPASLSPRTSGDATTSVSQSEPPTSNEPSVSISHISSGSSSDQASRSDASKGSGIIAPQRPSTPSQFIFKKPEYNHHYHNTHFHHLEKKETVLHDLKRFFKGGDKKSKSHHKLSDHKKKKKVRRETSSTAMSITSRASDISFANDFNRDIEGRYGKWGKLKGMAVL